MKQDKFLFIHEFSWHIDAGLGDPLAGRVYPATDIGSQYSVTLTTYGGGLILEKELLEGDFDNWRCKIEEIDLYNLLDLPILAEDIKKMAEWQAEDTPQAQETNKEERPQTDTEQAFESSMFMLGEDDRDSYDVLLKIMTLISDSYQNDSYVSLTEGLTSNHETGKQASAVLAAAQIESYLNEKNPEKLGELLNAIHTLVSEAIRAHKYNLINT